MADIRRYPFVRHLRGAPTTHVLHQRRGRVRHEGTGQAFFFRPLTAVLSEVPVDDRELPLLFHARTADFQDVSVQAAVTFRISDPNRAAGRLDFSIDPDSGLWRAAPLEQLASLLTQLAQQQALDTLAQLPLARALVEGLSAVRAAMNAGLLADARLEETGVSVVGIRVAALSPEPEVQRALQATTREQVQGQADRAGFERRAAAVESERAIAENELASQLELARRTEALVAQRGVNEQRRAREEVAAQRTAAEGAAERTTIQSQADAGRVRAAGQAEADAQRALLEAAASVDPAVLTALALRELAGGLPPIGQLTLTPDVLTGLLARLQAGAAGQP